jgi:transposase
VPGRKTDVSDAAWLRQLHSYGLLRGSFRPDAEIATLRAYLRQRERLVEYAAAHIQHMQKALMEMNLQLHHVVSDITGATGMRIVRAIVAGERNPDALATYRDVRCHSSTETIRAALVGNDRHEHVFALTQSLELYDVYQAKMLDCDRKLEVLIAALNNKGGKPVGKLSKPRIKTKQVNAPTFDVRTALYGVLGVDLTEIHGLGLHSHSSSSASAAQICGHGRAPSTSRLGSASHRATKSPAARYYLHAHGDLPVGQPHCCGWQPQPWGGAIRRSEHSIAGCPHVRASRRP